MISAFCPSTPLQCCLSAAMLSMALLSLTACGARDPALAPATATTTASTPVTVPITAPRSIHPWDSCPYCFCLDYSATCI
jgi:predicted small lipoprotein YifL